MAAPEAPATPTVLVTGGAGYVGSHVCKALHAAGYRPVTYDDMSGGHRWAVRWGPLERGDLANPAQLETVFRRYHPAAVIHLAGLIAAGESVEDPAKYYQANVVGTLNLLNAMRRAQVDRIVFSSSAAIYGEPQATPIVESHPALPINPYGVTKLAGERMLQDFASAYRLNSVSLRYFNAAGADPDGEIGEAHPVETHLIPLVLDVAMNARADIAIYGRDYPTRDGTCIRDYVHVSDLAAAHVLALNYLGRADGAYMFNLGSGSGATVGEVIAAARKVTGRPIKVRHELRRRGDPAVLVADPAEAKRQLGWRPKYPEFITQIETAWSWHGRRLSLMAG
jgi:UDP-glucose-4-epimerase GalE